MSQLEITSCGEQIDISVFEDLSITIPDEFNGQSITVPICQDSLVVNFFDPTPFPAFLFAAGEQGVWFDPSDLSTMFQDSAGTTPVTAVEQPVGRILDKSGRGNTATQATSASRPVLSARVNQLTYSEQFDNAAWSRFNVLAFGSGSVVDATTAPNGTTTADLIVEDTATSAHFMRQSFTVAVGVNYTFTAHAKANQRTKCALHSTADGTAKESLFDLSNGTVISTGVGQTASIISVGNGWYRCSITTTGASAISRRFEVRIVDASNNTTYTGDGTSGIYIWGADLRPTNQTTLLPAYQRIAAATDYDTTGFPLYLRFDGADDFLATGSIDPGAGVEAQMFAGVRAETPRSNNSPVWQFGDTTTTATDALLRILTGDGSTDSYRASLNGSAINQTPRVTKVVPYTVVFSTLYDAAATGTGEISLRENGTVTASGSATDSGITSFGSQVLYIGRQAAAAGYLNGKIYSLIVRFGANLDAATISNTETWVNGKTMAY